MTRRRTKELEALRKSIQDPRHSPKAAIDAIKLARSKSRINIDEDQLMRIRNSPFVGHSRVVAKTVESELIGWWKVGQTSGRPNKQHPIDVEISAAEEQYLRAVLNANKQAERIVGLKDGAKVAGGKASGRSRQQTAQGIIEMARVVAPGRNQAAVIARRIGATPKHVREILKKRT